jgi:hypothetical protein
MRKLLLILIFMSFSAFAEVTEMRMPNEAEGFVSLTMEACNFEKIKLTYPYRAYATEKNVSEVHEGCWVSPSLDDAPKHPSIKLIPVVNTWWETGDRATFLVEQFKPFVKD